MALIRTDHAPQLTFSADRGGVPNEAGQARADSGVLLDRAGGVLAARLGRAGVEAVLADACQVLGAVRVAGALGLRRGIWARQTRARCSDRPCGDKKSIVFAGYKSVGIFCIWLYGILLQNRTKMLKCTIPS